MLPLGPRVERYLLKTKNETIILPRPKINTTTKSDLALTVCKTVGISQANSYKLVNDIMARIGDSLLIGEKVKLAGFGTFATRDKPERIGRNPKTGKAVVIAPRRVVVFKPSVKLTSRVNSTLSSTEKRYDFEKA